MKYWILDASPLNEVGYVKTFDCQEDVDEFLAFTNWHGSVVTTNLTDMQLYCVEKGLDWRKFVLTHEPTPVILLTETDSDEWQQLKDKALVEHGCRPVYIAKFRKEENYNSHIANDWLDSSGAKYFLYLNLQ